MERGFQKLGFRKGSVSWLRIDETVSCNVHEVLLRATGSN